MTFGTAITSCFTRYAGFTGRARRSEYWFFALFSFLVYLVAALLDAAIGGRVLTALVFLGLLLPSLAVAVRRLHDTDRSGWWLLIGLVPFAGGIVLLVFECMDGQPHPNRFGPSPKTPVGGGWAPYGQQPGSPPAPWGQQPWPQQGGYPQAPWGQQPGHPQGGYQQQPYPQQPYPQDPPGPGSWS